MGIWKPSRDLVRDLQARGTRTRATVVKIARAGPTTDQGRENSYDPIDTETRRKTTIRLPTATGEVQVTARLNYRLGGLPEVGGDIPVIYDPDDPERVIVDEMVHVAEVTETHGGPVTHVGAVGEISFGDPGELIANAGYDQEELLDQARRLMADPSSAVAPATDGATAMAHLEALHAKGLMTDQELEAARRHLQGP